MAEARKMAPTCGLFQSADPKKWQQVSDIYWDVVAVAAVKKKRLLELDRWFQEELPVSICARAEKSLTRDELVRLMEWKLQRGKFRPRLQQMAASNPDGAVTSCTEKAFRFLPDISAAIEELCRLKGIGPATASAVLCAGAPEQSAFMADEAVESVPGLAPIQYNLKHYLRFLEEIRKKAETLNAESQEEWTPHRVELCLWAWNVAQKLCPKLLEDGDDGDERPSKRRKRKN